MKRLLILAMVVAVLPACTSAQLSRAGKGAMRVAQFLMSGYKLYVTGSANGVLASNSRYIAVDADVDVSMKLYGPDAVTGEETLLWQHEVKHNADRRAYELLFDDSNRFVTVRRVPWEQARRDLTKLPPADDEET